MVQTEIQTQLPDFAAESTPTEPHFMSRTVGRRPLLKVGAVVAAGAVAKFPAAESFDRLVDAERFLEDPVNVLVPRESNGIVAASEAVGQPVGIQTNYHQRGGQTLLNLSNSANELRADITRIPVAGGEYVKAGEGFITTAGGPRETQEYSALFVQKDDHGDITSALAVGYNGGMYTYIKGLGNEDRDPNKSSGEWVKLTKNNESQTSPVHTTTPWAQLEASSTTDMRIQEIASGTSTLATLGYRPWPSILPSSETPLMDSVTLTPDNSASNLDELGPKRYLAFGNTYIEQRHARDKARETLELYALLLYQHKNGAQNPSALIEYASSISNSHYEFGIDPASLNQDNIADLTFSLMNHVSLAMEGISQRWVQERTAAGRVHSGDGLNAEDFFSNSVGIVGMLELIKNQPNIMADIMHRIQAGPNMSTEQAWREIRGVVQDIAPNLPDEVIRQTASRFGIRQILQAENIQIPMATDPLIPIEIHPGGTPAHLDLQAAGVNPNNPSLRYRLTHAPAIEPLVGKLRSQIRDKLPV